jgi:dienelactone hydrolase
MLRGAGEYRVERWLAGGVPLVCVYPAGFSPPLPVVVVYHRFCGRNTDDLLRLALPLADFGVAAVLPEAALHGERAPQDLDDRLAQDRDGLFTRVLDATVGEAHEVIAWISSRADLDPTRVGVVGTAMGGAVALAVSCGVHFPGPKVAVALMPLPERALVLRRPRPPLLRRPRAPTLRGLAGRGPRGRGLLDRGDSFLDGEVSLEGRGIRLKGPRPGLFPTSASRC